jgi:CHAD domain-containing protein
VEEHELKLVLAEDTPLPEATDLFDGLGPWRDQTVQLVATYYDTSDLRLARAGVSVRFRSDHGWTVKTPIASDAAGLRRTEHGLAGAAGERPALAEELVLGWTRGAALAEVAQVSTDRRRLELLDDDRRVAEIDDDRVRTEAVDGPPMSFREIEVELAAGADTRLLKELGRRMRHAGATVGNGGPLPKVVRALGERALAPPDLPRPGALPRDATVGELVRHAISTSVLRLVEHDHLVRLGDDPEGVHQARVATRRLRSDLRTFAPVLDGRWVGELRAELRWLGDLLGHVRDTDVLLEQLDRRAELLPEPDRAAVTALEARAREIRTGDRAALLDAMLSTRYLTLLDRLVVAAGAPPFLGDEAARRARRLAPELARRSWRRLRRTVAALPDRPTDEELHEVRKRAKHTRYALEAIAPVTGRDVRRLTQRVSAIQDVLGEHHDAIVATAWLRDAAVASGNPSVAFGAGALAETFGAEAELRRARWRRQWRRARKRATSVF